MNTFGGNKGYVGYSMSKRAVQARNNGKFPKTDFKKEYGMSEKIFKLLDEIGAIGIVEWHHTSVYGNRTDFYGWSDDSDLDIWEDHHSEIKSLARQIKNQPKLMDYPATRDGMDRYTSDCDEVNRSNKVVISKIKDMFNY